MSIPEGPDIILPLIQFASDVPEGGGTESEWTVDEAVRTLSDWLHFSFENTTLAPRAAQTRFYNRVKWAAMRFEKLGLLELRRDGRYRITDQGREFAKNPSSDSIDSLLMRNRRDSAVAIPPRKEDSQSVHGTESRLVQIPDEPGGRLSRDALFNDLLDPIKSSPPDERLEAAHEEIESALAADLLERVKEASPAFFEQLVIDLLLAMGYGGSPDDIHQRPRSRDGGIDGIINQDRLGLERLHVQAKRWTGPVGQPIVREFAGSLDGVMATKGVFITTSNFTRDAEDFVIRIPKRIVLIDGTRLAQLMIEYGVGVSVDKTYAVKKPDSDYFDSVSI